MPISRAYDLTYSWRDHKAHGLYADGSTSNGTNYGAWLVLNTRDTFFGGPLHSDLTVDGITYNYVSIPLFLPLTRISD